MSNTERNRTSDNILMGYLIDLIQGDETSNQSNINNIIDTLNLYQRNVERYHRNMENLIGILRSYVSRQSRENQSIPQNQQRQSRDISNNNINNYFRDTSSNLINNYFRDISNNDISQYTPFSTYRTTPTYPASTGINTTSERTPTA